MFSKIWIINLILIIITGVLCSRAYNVWTEPEPVQTASLTNQDSKENSGIKKNRSKKILSESAYKVIVDKNLFSPNREEFIPDETEPEPEQINVSGQKISLYGVVIIDDYKKALIDNPVRTPDDRPEKWVEVGDVVGELTVAAINKESILLKEGSKKYEILLYDRKKRIARASAPVKEKKSSPNVVSTGSKKSKPKPSDSSKKEKVSESEYEEVVTPFGKIKRRKKQK